MTMLEELQQKMKQAADDSPYAENILVFGEGKLSPQIAMIGEAPGGDEEKHGHPFVGKAGKNLTEFLNIIGLSREELYISNVVKLRPTNLSTRTGNPINRPPSKEEIAFFLPFLIEELGIVAPKIIVTLGNVPLRALLQDPTATIGEHHGHSVITPDGLSLFPLYHPASMIYNPSIKTVYMEDLEALRFKI